MRCWNVRLIGWVLVCLPVCLLACQLFGSVAALAQSLNPRLELQVGPIDPITLPAPQSDQASVRLLQFHAIPDRFTRLAIESQGATILAYLPENAYVVRVSPDSRGKLKNLAGLRWEGPLDWSWKLSKELGIRPIADLSRRAGGRYLAVIELWRDSDADVVASQAAALGAEIRAIWIHDGLRRLLVRASRPELERIAQLEDVQFIEEAPEPVLRNDGATWVVQSNVNGFRPIWDKGLHGEGQILGNIDGRLDMNSCYFSDSNAIGPAHRKVVAYRSNSGQGADSHGTHTVGTMVGDKGTPGTWDAGDGHAFAGKVSFSNLDDISGSGTSPSNLLSYLTSAHNDGARVHSNSWGDDGTRAYTTWSRDIDDFSWQKEESLVLFAVSNGGQATTPENAKNVVGVGASDRDGNANNHCSGGTGPTQDGRRKPELYAPGCSTVSAASGQSCGTRSLTGTSMACPAMTGAAALVRQYFTEGWYPSGLKTPADAFVPSGALLKATLTTGAQDMTGVGGYPSNTEGWGRINLDRSLYFDGDVRRLAVLADVRNVDGLQTSESLIYSLEVLSNSQPLRITLAFTDPPAAVLASNPVINDLNLKVTAPDGSSIYWGNNTNGNSESVAGGNPDAKNNLEQVLFTSPAVGLYTIEVIGAAIPQGPQGFALVSSGDIDVRVAAQLRYTAHRLADTAPLGNNDLVLDPGETAQVPVTLENKSSDPMTGISSTLTVDRPDLVRITRTHASWANLAPRATGESLAPHFELTAAPSANCGESVTFTITSTADQLESAQESNFSIDIGNPNRSYANGPARDLPKRFLGFISSPQTIPDNVLVREVDVTVDITHGDVGELLVSLVSPDNTNVRLHSRTHAGEANLRLRYDRDRAVDGPGSLDDFIGRPAQGSWQLAIGDNVDSAVGPGRLNSWTLHLTADRPLSCNPLSCGSPIPGVVGGLLATKVGNDIRFEWASTSGAAGYHVLSSVSPQFSLPSLVSKVGAVTSTVAVGEATPVGRVTLYQVRAVNSCNWEGP
jgi:subtilisin-like proprotein convertase family protein